VLFLGYLASPVQLFILHNIALTLVHLWNR